MSVLYSNSRIFVIPVYTFNGRKQTLVDMIGILSALCMHGLHDKLHICGCENWFWTMCIALESNFTKKQALKLVSNLVIVHYFRSFDISLHYLQPLFDSRSENLIHYVKMPDDKTSQLTLAQCYNWCV